MGQTMESWRRLTVLVALACVVTMAGAQQPPEPLDMRPIDGEVYYLINQHSGLQADLAVSIHNRWQLIPSTNGYYAVRNRDTHRLLDVTEESTAPAAAPVSSRGRELSFHITPTL